MKNDKYIELLSNYFQVQTKEKFFADNDLSYRIKKAFSFSYVEINHLSFVVAKYNGTQFSISEFNHVKNVIENNNSDYALFYFDKLTIQNKMSLTKFGLGYIIGNQQFYIPQLSILIHEYYNYNQIKSDRKLSLGTQNILFKLLLLDKIDTYQKELNDIIKEKEYEVYRAIKELENKNILTIEKLQGHRVIRLDDKAAIWNKAKPLLQSPIMEEKYVDKDSLLSQKIQLVESGQFMLSKKGMIVSNEEIYAIENKQFKEIKNLVKQSFEGFDNAVKLQVWKSKIVKTENNELNPFALYLSLKDDYDERVQKDYEDYISKYWG
jgi:hypothetical protein